MKTFNNLFVLGRPAGGKSEFIDFMKKISDEERAREFHIGKFEEIDDFPWLWDACIEDDAHEGRGEQRLYSVKTPEGHNITKEKFRSSLIGRFNDAITEKYLRRPEFYKDGTLLIEFARGKTDGFMESLAKFKKEILKDAAILYINVSFEESFRRNSARYKCGLESSILCHKVPDKDMYEFFIENDWADITDNRIHGMLDIGGIKVPFVSMLNEPELPPGKMLAKRYKQALDQLLTTQMHHSGSDPE